jgi:muramoyltetrapeptide carboxypeptidase LdcA involved in peptidoglycan recycling
VGTELPVHKNTGFALLQGPAQFEGEILGGCIDSMYEMFSGWRHADMPEVCKRYGLFPDLDDWRGKILLLESCEEYMPPETYKKALETLKDTGVFDVVSGVLVGKPMDEVYAAEYKKLLAGVIANKELPIVCNLNIGHALPRCILPFGVRARVDAGEQVIRFG